MKNVEKERLFTKFEVYEIKDVEMKAFGSLRCCSCKQKQKAVFRYGLRDWCSKCITQVTNCLPTAIKTAPKSLWVVADMIYCEVVHKLMHENALYSSNPRDVASKLYEEGYVSSIKSDKPEETYFKKEGLQLELVEKKKKELIQYYVLNRLKAEQNRVSRLQYKLENNLEATVTLNDYPQDLISSITGERLLITDVYLDRRSIIFVGTLHKAYGRKFFSRNGGVLSPTVFAK